MMKRILSSALLLVLSMNAYAQSTEGDDSVLRKGLVFEDKENETYKLKLGFRVQPLFTTNFRDFEVLDDPQLIETGAQIRRARIKFDGYLGDPRWVYKFEIALGNRNIGGIDEHTSMGARAILDAVIKYQIAGGRYSFWFGQTKLPGNRERVVSSQKLQFVDRSIVNSRFNLDRDMGFQFHGKETWFQQNWKWAVALSQGEGRNITDNNFGGFEYTGRLEWLPFGNFTNKGDYVESDIYREEKFKLSIGGTFDFNNNAVRTRANQGDWLIDTSGVAHQRDITTYIVDVMAKYRGWSLLTEWIQRDIESPQVFDEWGGEVGAYYSGMGISSQIGYVFPSNWELAGRYSYVAPDAGVTSSGNYEQYTLAVSRFVYGHNVKVQADVTLTNYVQIDQSDPLMFRFQMEIGF